MTFAEYDLKLKEHAIEIFKFYLDETNPEISEMTLEGVKILKSQIDSNRLLLLNKDRILHHPERT